MTHFTGMGTAARRAGATLALLALAGCANLGLSDPEPVAMASAAPSAAASAEQPSAPPARSSHARTQTRATPAARGQSGAPVAAEPEQPMTLELARGECWMAMESDRKAPKDLTERSKRVEVCAQKKVDAAGGT